MCGPDSDSSDSKPFQKTREIPKRKTKPKGNSVVLDGPPPILRLCEEIDSFVPGVIEVYALLWQSGYIDQRLEYRKKDFWSDRQDCGGTSSWSIKGLSDKLHIGHSKVEKAINALIMNGFIRVLKFVPTGKGKRKRVFQVIHLNQIDSVRHSLDILGEPFGLCPYKPQKEYVEPVLNEFEEIKTNPYEWPYGPHEIVWTDFGELLQKHFKYVDRLAKEECQ